MTFDIHVEWRNAIFFPYFSNPDGACFTLHRLSSAMFSLAIVFLPATTQSLRVDDPHLLPWFPNTTLKERK